MAIQDTAKEFFLDELGRTNGHLSELAAAWLATQGHTTGSIDERWQSYLAATGGALPSESLSRYLIGPLRAGASGITLAAAVSSLFQSSEPGVFYDPSDLSSLYQTSTGSTPVTSHNDPVGLMLDKRLMSGKTAAAFIASQPELCTGGLFDSSDGWGLSGGWSISDGKLVASGAAGTLAYFEIDEQPAGYYQLEFDVDERTASDVTLRLYTSANSNVAISGHAFYTTTGTKTAIAYANAPWTRIGVQGGGAGYSGKVDNISVKAIPGNHAVQATSSARPVYKTEPHPNTDYSGQAELADYAEGFSSLTGITGVGATVALAGSTLVATSTSADGVDRAEIPVSGLTVGKHYEVTVRVKRGAQGAQQALASWTFATIATTAITSTTAADYTFVVRATATSGIIRAYSGFASSAIGDEVVVENISVKEVPANAQYLHWIEGDGVDDFLRATFTIAQPWDRISAIRQVSWTSLDRIFGMPTGDGRLIQRTATPTIAIFDGTGAVEASTLAIGEDGVITERHADTASRLAVNNGAYQTGTTGSTLPGGMELFGNANAGNARIYPVIMREGTLTDAQIARLRTLIGAKAGLTL